MLAEFLETLFDSGDVVFRIAPPEKVPDTGPAGDVLRHAFVTHWLDLAGPPPDFDLPAALAAAEFTWRACWYLVYRDAPDEELTRQLKLPPAPRTASQHLSADLTFRHLPQLYRRARVIATDDVLSTTLLQVLRTWPLAGVTADIDEPPLTVPDFEGHAGLELLYAERYVRHPRESWRPTGRIAEYVNMLTASAIAQASGA